MYYTILDLCRLNDIVLYCSNSYFYTYATHDVSLRRSSLTKQILFITLKSNVLNTPSVSRLVNLNTVNSLRHLISTPLRSDVHALEQLLTAFRDTVAFTLPDWLVGLVHRRLYF